MFNSPNQPSYEAMPGYHGGSNEGAETISESQQQTASAWESAMSDVPPFAGDNTYTEMPGINESVIEPDDESENVAEAGTDIGDLAEAIQDGQEEESTTSGPAYLEAFQQGNAITTNAAREAVSGAHGIGTEALRHSLQAQGFSNDDIIRTANLHAADHLAAERAAYASDNTNETEDQRDAALIATAVGESALKATARSQQAIEAAKNGNLSEARTLSSNAEQDLQQVMRLAGATIGANRFVDDVDLSGRLNLSLTRAINESRRSVESARKQVANAESGLPVEANIEETNDNYAPKDGTEELEKEEQNEAAQAEQADTETPQSEVEKLNPAMLGENSAQAPNEEEPTQQSAEASIFDSAAFAEINPLNAAVEKISQEQNDDKKLTIEQLGKIDANAPSASMLENSLNSGANYGGEI
jgi:hypothetical protein